MSMLRNPMDSPCLAQLPALLCLYGVPLGKPQFDAIQIYPE